jgi:hypothetical protein
LQLGKNEPTGGVDSSGRLFIGAQQGVDVRIASYDFLAIQDLLHDRAGAVARRAATSLNAC